MQGDRAIVEKLNEVLTNELTSVNQYFLHARMLQNWGFNRLGRIVYEESIGEMKHADKLIKRILYLEGLPNLQDLNKLAVGETVLEALQADLALELRGRATLIGGVGQCETAQDFVSREILVEILSDTEEHIDFLETQLSLAKSLGEQNYLQSAAGELTGSGDATSTSSSQGQDQPGWACSRRIRTTRGIASQMAAKPKNSRAAVGLPPLPPSRAAIVPGRPRRTKPFCR